MGIFSFGPKPRKRSRKRGKRKGGGGGGGGLSAGKLFIGVIVLGLGYLFLRGGSGGGLTGVINSIKNIVPIPKPAAAMPMPAAAPTGKGVVAPVPPSIKQHHYY